VWRSRAGFLGLGLATALATIAVPSSAVQASAPPGTTCAVFPADNVWNTDISSLPVHSRSAAWLSSTGATSGTLLHPDFGGPPYGIPFNVVDNTHATANFNFLYWQESDPTVATQQAQGPYPYGTDLQVEGPTDSHLLTINKNTCKLYEIAGTNYNGPQTGWSGAIFDLSSNSLRPDTWTSADAAGLPIFPGLVRLDEVQAGAINHAIRFTVVQSDTSHLWPARHDAGTTSNPNLVPMGARFRLKSTFNISGFNAQTQVVLTAMKHYGLIAADNGSNWFFQGTEDSGWNVEPYATMVSQLKTVPASAFEAVDESSLMVDPNSGLAVVPVHCASVTASAAPPSPSLPGTAVTFTASASGCPNPRYQFWTLAPGGAWTIAQSYSSSATFNWNTSGLPAGAYHYSVWVRDASSAAGYDAYTGNPYTLTSTTCRSMTASAAPPSPQAVGTAVTVTASASGCTNPRYQFWTLAPAGSWTIVQPYSSSATLNWTTTGLPAGTYHYSVWVRDASSASSYDTYFPGTAYTLTSTVCASVTASAAPASPQARGTSVTFTAVASGCPNARYQFWILAPSGSWTIVRAYSSTATFNWMTAGLPGGTYHYSVWVRDASSAAGYDAYFPGTAYLLT
jgi:hypothetical protein